MLGEQTRWAKWARDGHRFVLIHHLLLLYHKGCQGREKAPLVARNCAIFLARSGLASFLQHVSPLSGKRGRWRKIHPHMLIFLKKTSITPHVSQPKGLSYSYWTIGYALRICLARAVTTRIVEDTKLGLHAGGDQKGTHPMPLLLHTNR